MPVNKQNRRTGASPKNTPQWVKVKAFQLPEYKQFEGRTGRILGADWKERVRVVFGEVQVWFDLNELQFVDPPASEEAAA